MKFYTMDSRLHYDAVHKTKK